LPEHIEKIANKLLHKILSTALCLTDGFSLQFVVHSVLHYGRLSIITDPVQPVVATKYWLKKNNNRQPMGRGAQLAAQLYKHFLS